MRQTLHILKKDVRYLYGEIGLTIAAIALDAWIQARHDDELMWPGFAHLLTVLTALYLISRVIHLEPAGGGQNDRRFWITRPYRGWSVLIAKGVFIAAFVNIPLFVAHAWALNTSGFQAEVWLPRLLERHGSILAITLAASALAAITPGLGRFIMGILVVWIAVPLLALLGAVPPGPPFGSWRIPILVIAGLSFTVVCIAYGARREALAWNIALVGGGVTAVLIHVLAGGGLPHDPTVAEVDAILTPSKDVAWRNWNLRVTNVQGRALTREEAGGKDTNLVGRNFQISADVQGLPEGFDLLMLPSEVALGSRHWPLESESVIREAKTVRGGKTETVTFAEYITPAMLQALGREDAPIFNVTFSAALFRARRETVSIGETPVGALSLRCRRDGRDKIACRSPLGWLDGQILIEAGSHTFGFSPTDHTGAGLDLFAERIARGVPESKVTLLQWRRVDSVSLDAPLTGLRPADMIRQAPLAHISDRPSEYAPPRASGGMPFGYYVKGKQTYTLLPAVSGVLEKLVAKAVSIDCSRIS